MALPAKYEMKRYHDGLGIADDYAVVTVGANDLPETTVSLYIGTGGGDITVNTINAAGVVFKNVVSGQVIYGRFTQVTAASGTVADILAGYCC